MNDAGLAERVEVRGVGVHEALLRGPPGAARSRTALYVRVSPEDAAVDRASIEGRRRRRRRGDHQPVLHGQKSIVLEKAA